MNWLCCLSPRSGLLGSTGGVELKGFQGILELRTGGVGAREGISQQDMVSHNSIQEGRVSWELATQSALIWLSTALLSLCWTGKGLGYSPFRY